MEKGLDHYIKSEPKLAGALIGMSVRSAKKGEKLYEHMGDIRLRPASNMKLLTATAALAVLGEDYTFSTEILTDGFIKNNQLQGNLYIKGKGDPTILAHDFDHFVKELRSQGVTKITGDIIGDDTWYDGIRLSPDMIWSDEHFYYGSQVSALTASPTEDYDAGSVIIEAAPGLEIGDLTEVNVSPKTNYVKIINTAITAADDREVNITIERIHGENTIIVKGEIPVGADPIKEYIAVWEPTGYALDLFQQALKNNDISWGGTICPGKTPENINMLIMRESIPLSELLIPFMKLSNNGLAEILVKEMGKVARGKGSWEKGLEVLEDVLSKFGMNRDTIFIRDGSGISHANLIPANEISKLLFTVQKEDWFPTFLSALPLAGDVDRMVGGTLNERMKDTKVQAKTGTIYSVSTLSGYLTTKQNVRLIFSIMINNLLDEEEGKDIEDRIVDVLVNKYKKSPSI